MAKPKLDLKAFLLKRGEVLAMGFAGLCLLILLVMGAGKWTSAKDPGKTAEKLKSQANQVRNNVENGDLSEEAKTELVLPPWLSGQQAFLKPKATDFAQAPQPMFDPTAQPNTKRENPIVHGIGEYQVDLTRAAMLGYDITLDGQGKPFIAILTTKSESKIDDAKIDKASKAIRDAINRGKQARDRLGNNNRPQNPPMNPMGPMGGPGGAGPGAPPPLGGAGGLGGPHGFMGGDFDQNGQRNEKAIKYVPLDEIDKSVKDGNLPAFTVIPLRMVTVHAVVPYKKQLDEIKRALRLPAPAPKLNASGKIENQAEIDAAEAQARLWGPVYDGFEVQRRVTRYVNGKPVIEEDWPEKPRDPKDTSGNYKFEELYIEKIDTKKIADHFDEGYIPYFLKPDMMLSMPLPQLAKDLNVKYPEIKLKDILDNIEKLKKANEKELTQSELAKKLSGVKTRNDLYKSKTSDDVGGFGYDPTKYGPTTGGTGGSSLGPPPAGGGAGPVVPPMPGAGSGGKPMFPEGYGPASGAVTAKDVENYLLRFVDCDVKPGKTYEYRIRLRMVNPNFGQTALVANPEFAKESNKLLYSKWAYLETAITVPAESFLYAHDVKAYRDKIEAEYPSVSITAENITATPETKAVNSLLQVKDNQTVLQVVRWMEQVRTDSGAKREPVGSWVVAEMPVGRGEFVGRKQYIKLPLWSSETQQYTLREVADKVVKGKFQPKGWLVDFSTRSVLVDFEGGKVKSRVNVRFDERGNAVPINGRNIDEDAANEVLIVREDGKLVVRSSQADEADAGRKAIVTEWARWVSEVQKRPAGTSGGMGEPNPFDPKK